MTDPWSVLSPHQIEVARPWIAARDAERPHLVIYLSGAHAYGFPSPDSDLDLKCIHVAPTSKIVGLTEISDPPDRIETVDGVELDYGSNELAVALRGAIKGNGNFLERFLGDLALGGDAALLDDARAVVRPLLSRRIARHYGGFAMSQLKAFDEKPTAKRALYVIRTSATGRYCLARGLLATDIARTAEFVPTGVDELLAIKRSGETAPLPAELAAAWRARLVDAIAAVDAALAASVLPVEPSDAALAAVDAWLVGVRQRLW
jgi:hypothetical protein